MMTAPLLIGMRPMGDFSVVVGNSYISKLRIQRLVNKEWHGWMEKQKSLRIKENECNLRRLVKKWENCMGQIFEDEKIVRPIFPSTGSSCWKSMKRIAKFNNIIL